MIIKSKVYGFDMVQPLEIIYFLESYEFHFLKHVEFDFDIEANL